MIFVDPAVGDILQRRQLAVIRTIYTVLTALSYVGIHRPLWSAVMRPVTSKMPPVDQARLIQDLCDKAPFEPLHVRHLRSLAYPH
jgi:hypothetical protein